MLHAIFRHSWRCEPPVFTRRCASAVFSPETTEGGKQGDLARNCLSAENERRCRGVLEEPTGRYRSSKAYAAVLVPLCSVAGEPSFLYTLRSNEMQGRHKGDVSFPGGKCDSTDLDLIHTAMREAQEELGMQVLEQNIWGVMKPFTAFGGMVVAPVIADVGPLESLTLNPNSNEVEDIFTLSIPHLCKEHNQAYTNFRMNGRYAYTLPIFLGGRHRVWGLTAILTDSALKLLVAGAYASKLHGSRKV